MVKLTRECVEYTHRIFVETQNNGSFSLYLTQDELNRVLEEGVKFLAHTKGYEMEIRTITSKQEDEETGEVFDCFEGEW